MYVYSDGVLPNGDVHMTGFGADQRGVFVPEEDPQAAVEESKKVHPMDVQSMVKVEDATGDVGDYVGCGGEGVALEVADDVGGENVEDAPGVT